MSEIFDLANYYVNFYAFPHFASALFWILFGVFVYFQNRTSLTTISYLSVCVSGFLWIFGDAASMSSLSRSPTLFWIKIVYVGVTFIPPSLFFFSSVWLNMLEKNKRLIIMNYVIGSIFVVLFLTTDFFVVGYQRHYFGNFSRLGRWSFVYLAYFFSVSSLFFYSIFKSYFVETSYVKKIHKKTILVAFFIAFCGSVEFMPTFGISLYPIGFLSSFLLNLIVAYGIINHKLMDIETVAHKTIAWFFSNLVILVPFVGIIYILRPWLQALNGFELVSFVTALSLVFLFLFRYYEPKIDHFFQRRRYNLEEIAGKLIDEIVYVKDFDSLIQKVEKAIKNTLYVQKAEIFIYNEEKKRYQHASQKEKLRKPVEIQQSDPFLTWLAANNCIAYREYVGADPLYGTIRKEAIQYFMHTNTYVVVPLVINDRLIGLINLDKKQNLKRYSSMDIHFLKRIKNEITITIFNALAYDHIENEVKVRTQQLVEVQKQLVQAEKLATVGTLAGGVAHEINNPLTAILTNVQMLLAGDVLKDASDKESLQLIEDATKRCRTVVQKLMTYARKPLETGQMVLIDAHEVIKKVVSFLAYQLGQEDITVMVRSEGQTYGMKGNHNELEQVFTNMILNARDAIKRVKKSGTVDISLYHNNDRIVIKIKDDGVGMSKDVMSKIFDPFFTTKDVGKGMGLGLSICQSIVDRHGGSIQADSEPNKGTTFTLEFPSATIPAGSPKTGPKQ